MLTCLTLGTIDGSYAYCLAVGAMTSRDRAVSGKVVVKDYDGEDRRIQTNADLLPKFFDEMRNPGCYRYDNKTWKKSNFQASQALLNDLEWIFLQGENRCNVGEKRNAAKYTPDQAYALLKNITKPDGSRKYSTSPDNPNGPLPSEQYIKGKFSRRKKEGARKLMKRKVKDVDHDEYQSMGVEEMKQICSNIFGKEILELGNLLVHILELDDIIKYSDSESDYYKAMSITALQTECKNKKLPMSICQKSLRLLILRAYKHNDVVQEHANATVNDLDSTAKIMQGHAMMKNQGARYLKVNKGDKYDSKTLDQLEECMRWVNTENELDFAKAVDLLRSLIEIDDILRIGFVEKSYDKYSSEQLEDACKIRDLPTTKCESAFKIILRANALKQFNKYFV